ncbi:LacI family DNA-binding transcriptional regulator [Sphingobium phenoxybenzoativorans]|uniref:LacI family DNA-binding transcriptional regulator n=1 Tax=Sphingobium phenoxybenzoativorans TaxID=1592790 RepID=A0A975K6X4_9SPHN|nr:LacI family DNA-binding transcriptional regulator [Sphingobium phenoxybenzoativorans]QUT05925.1 LacI family DNA-binding transcriptional regulator [Sphingobium phenoxybenzoativorans]
MPRATIADVARVAGVSIKTASRVLNREPHVSAAKQAMVEQAILSLNYRPSQIARSLKGSRSFQIALLYDNPSAAYFQAMHDGARQLCDASGFRLMTQAFSVHAPTMVGEIIALIDDMHVEGLILSPPLTDCCPLLEALDARRVPFVRIAPTVALERAGFTLMDDMSAAEEATAHLISLGHRAIGFVRGHPDHGAASQRFEGYRRALERAGLAFDEALTAQGAFTFASGREAAAELLEREDRPSAIFASNDDMAAGVLAYAHEAGIDVPADLSIMGFDDNQIAQMIWPPLTTIRQPVQALAYGAARLLLDRLETGRDATMTFDFELIQRGSTCARTLQDN